MGIFKGWAGKIYEDFENGVGTYLKVIRFPEPTNPDGFAVLYLRSTGFFLFLAYWRGYERSAVAGRWLRHDEVIELDGDGGTQTDAPPDYAGRFHRSFNTDVKDHTPVLTADTGLSGWSLLGWAGSYAYVGSKTIIKPDGEWLPRSHEEVDTWIQRLMA